MAQDFAPDDGGDGHRNPRDDSRDERDASHRWPAEAPSAAIAQVVLKLDDAITLKRRAAAAWLTAHGDVLPALPIKPSRMELAVFMALAETYGAAGRCVDAFFLKESHATQGRGLTRSRGTHTVGLTVGTAPEATQLEQRIESQRQHNSSPHRFI